MPDRVLVARRVTSPPRFTVGAVVELRDAPFDTVGTVVAVMSPDEVRVEWNTGQGLLGKTTMVSTRALRERRGEHRAAENRLRAPVGRRLERVTPESESRIHVGDRVTLRDVGGRTAGLVLELLDDGLARVEWTAGKGVVGRHSVHAVRELRKLPADAALRKRYMRGSLSDLDVLDKYLATLTGTLPFDAGEVRHALAQRPAQVDGDAPMGLPLAPAVAEALQMWLVKNAQHLAERGQDTMSALLQRITVDP